MTFYSHFLFSRMRQPHKLNSSKFTTIWDKNADNLLEYLGYIGTNYKPDLKVFFFLGGNGRSYLDNIKFIQHQHYLAVGHTVY